MAYSSSGTLVGPWQQEPAPTTPPHYGYGMLFRTFEGKDLLVLHSHLDIKGNYRRVPRLFEANLSGDKPVIGKAFHLEEKMKQSPC